MSCHAQLQQWQRTIMHHLPHLSKPQAAGLALWTLGMVLSRSCALSAVSGLLATVLQRPANTLRQRLRDSYLEAEAKRGAGRRQLGGRDLFCPPAALGDHVVAGTQLALALDATSLGSRFVVLAVSVLYRGCAVPVAWVVLPANRPGAWRPHWLRLLRRLHRVIPRSWTVMVLSDRGLYARWLYRRLVRLGWHPCLRINTGGTFHPEGQARRCPPTGCPSRAPSGRAGEWRLSVEGVGSSAPC